jgi:hypothetical protein
MQRVKMMSRYVLAIIAGVMQALSTTQPPLRDGRRSKRPIYVFYDPAVESQVETML